MNNVDLKRPKVDFLIVPVFLSSGLLTLPLSLVSGDLGDFPRSLDLDSFDLGLVQNPNNPHCLGRPRVETWSSRAVNSLAPSKGRFREFKGTSVVSPCCRLLLLGGSSISISSPFGPPNRTVLDSGLSTGYLISSPPPWYISLSLFKLPGLPPPRYSTYTPFRHLRHRPPWYTTHLFGHALLASSQRSLSSVVSSHSNSLFYFSTLFITTQAST